MGTKETRYAVTEITRSELAILSNRSTRTIKRWLEVLEPELTTKKGYTPRRHSFTGEAAEFVLSELGFSPEHLAAIRPSRQNIQYKLNF